MVNDKKRRIIDGDFQRSINFFEELCWLLDSNKDINFKDASKTLKQWRNLMIHGECETNKVEKSYSLIGVLPSLLKDKELFSNNAKLAQFSEEVLSLSILRWDKRSRNEIIGLIICEVEDTNKQRIDQLSQWVGNILNHKVQVKDMQENAEKTGNLFSWNEAIQRLTGETNE